MKYVEVQRHVMHISLAILGFCIAMAVNMLSPVFEARLFALLGVFMAGFAVCYHIGVMVRCVGSPEEVSRG